MRFSTGFPLNSMVNVTVLLTVLVGEIAVRLLRRDGPLTLDEKLGWNP